MQEQSMLESKSEKWFAYIKSWEEGDKSQKAFCEENGLSYTAFAFWRSSYLKLRGLNKVKQTKTPATVTTKSLGFVPVKFPEQQAASANTIVARYQTGMTLSLPLSLPIADLVTLLCALDKHHAC